MALSRSLLLLAAVAALLIVFAPAGAEARKPTNRTATTTEVKLTVSGRKEKQVFSPKSAKVYRSPGDTIVFTYDAGGPYTVTFSKGPRKLDDTRKTNFTMSTGSLSGNGTTTFNVTFLPDDPTGAYRWTTDQNSKMKFRATLRK